MLERMRIMWEKILSSIGVGSVKVDTLVKEAKLRKGSTLKGEVLITAGRTEQRIESIVLTLFVRYEAEKEDTDFSYHEKEMAEIIINHDESIEKGVEKRIPFEIQLEKDHPVTSETVETFLRTTLIIPQAIDQKDEDSIIVTS